MKYFIYLFWLMVILLIVTFTSLNADWVMLHYYFGSTKVFFPFLLFVALLVGIVLGVLLLIPPVIKSKHHQRRLKKALKMAEQEIENLRSIPLKDAH